jgi:hypothetical protein
VGGAGGGAGVAESAVLAELVPRSQRRDLGHPADRFQIRVGRVFGLTKRDLDFLKQDTHTSFNTLPY